MRGASRYRFVIPGNTCRLQRLIIQGFGADYSLDRSRSDCGTPYLLTKRLVCAAKRRAVAGGRKRKRHQSNDVYPRIATKVRSRSFNVTQLWPTDRGKRLVLRLCRRIWNFQPRRFTDKLNLYPMRNLLYTVETPQNSAGSI